MCLCFAGEANKNKEGIEIGTDLNLKVQEIHEDSRFPAFEFEFQEKGGRVPFGITESISADIEFYDHWKVADTKQTEENIQILLAAMSHELWDKYVQSKIADVEEDYYTSIEKMNELGDISEEAQDWLSFLEQVSHFDSRVPVIFVSA